MTFTYEQGLAWSATRADTVRRNWNGWCEALMWWMLGGVTSSYESATHAYERSEVVSLDIMAAPPGAFHWWSIQGISEGHVAVAAGGGWAVMASGFLDDNFQGVNVGSTFIPNYHARMGGRARYLGWSYDHAGATFTNAPSLAAPAPVPIRKKLDMFNGRHPNGAITAFGETAATGLTAGMWRYYEPAYGTYVQLTAEEYEQEFINVKVRKASSNSGVVDEAAIAAQVRAGMDAYFEANKAEIAKLNASIGAPAA